MGAVCGRWWPIPSGLGRVLQSQRPPAGTSLQRSRELRGDWLAAGRGVSGPPPGPPGAHTAPVEWCVPHSSQASWGGDSRTSEEWRDEAQPSWVRRLGPSQLSLPTALGGGDPLEFRFRLLWLRAGGLQMKSPEKKRRKSNTQGPAYSHLTEFAPPPTPMVDHLVASNPFEDDFGAPKVGGAGPPFLGSPVPFGGFRVQGGMAGQVPPGYGTGGGGGPQPLRRQPPPFPPNPMGPAFNMPPQGPGYPPPGNMNFPSQPFNQSLGQNFSPPGGQMMPGPVGGFGPMISPTMGQPPRGELGPPPLPQRFTQPGAPFGPSLQRPGQGLPSLPPNTSPFPGPDPGFPGPGGEDGGKPLNPPAPTAFPQEPHSGSPAAAVNGSQPSFPPSSSGRGGGTPDANSLAPPGKAGGGSGPQPPPGLVYPCGACRSEVNDDQDAILCEASCQKWFHRECTGMTESAYGLLTTEASAVWACDLCLKTKEIQSVYIREGMGQLVAANDG